MPNLQSAFSAILLFCSLAANAQTDSTRTVPLRQITIQSAAQHNSVKRLAPVQGTYIYAGKKSEVVNVAQADLDVAGKSGRQVFAKVPGVFVYDMDGSGNQLNIAARGLDPHRGWEFNNRKDGVLTNSDMYGYPASHYSMPLEAVDHIELVRGTGSLQYGAQFGGMLNYVSKQPDSTRRFAFETVSSAGSFNLLSNYTAVDGTLGKFRYHAYVYKRTRDGYRESEHTDADAETLTISYQPGRRFSARLEWTRSRYTYQLPGPLTDAMFEADPRQATRTRNYYSPVINVPSLTLEWKPAPNTTLQWISSAVLGSRNSVQFDKAATIADTINALTLQYAPRQVDIDLFRSFTNELRATHRYRLGRQNATLAAGAQYMNNDLHRRQLGKGSTGSDYDLSLTDPNWGRDLHLRTQNFAFFAENNFQIAKSLSANLGARYETGASNLSGKIVYYPDNAIPLRIAHRFPLFGAGMNYTPAPGLECYAGWAQAYRPVIFKDIIPGSVYEKVDPNIRDARGYNAEAGFRGNWRFLKWDLSGFLLRYDNRLGTLALTDSSGALFTYRTNIGNARTVGVELFLEAQWMLTRKTELSIFTSSAWMDAHFLSGQVKSGAENIDISGNKVESTPPVISRNGVSLHHGPFSITLLYSYTAASYADALNTETPSATGAVGKVPAYGILDLNASIRLSDHVECRLNLNNLSNEQYFTKRPLFYPGPGIWPSDGRNASVTVAVRI